jgi:hypothetical protein
MPGEAREPCGLLHLCGLSAMRGDGHADRHGRIERAIMLSLRRYQHRPVVGVGNGLRGVAKWNAYAGQEITCYLPRSGFRGAEECG